MQKFSFVSKRQFATIGESLNLYNLAKYFLMTLDRRRFHAVYTKMYFKFRCWKNFLHECLRKDAAVTKVERLINQEKPL